MAAVLSLLVSCGKENPEEDYGLFKEPILTWGASKADIIKQLGEPTGKTEDSLDYESEDILYSYAFWDDKMTEATVFLPYSVPFADITAFMKEKYVFREEFSDESNLYFNTKDGSVSIWVVEDIMGSREIGYSKNTGDPL